MQSQYRDSRALWRAVTDRSKTQPLGGDELQTAITAEWTNLRLPGSYRRGSKLQGSL